MVVIRLSRHGKHKHPMYRIVVADQRKKRDGRIIEQVGTYDPHTDPSTIKMDLDKVESWIAKGAQPSTAVTKLICYYKGEPLPQKLQQHIEVQEEAKAAEEQQAAEEE